MSTTDMFKAGSVVRFEGLRLSKRPLPATVRATCERFAILTYRIGGVTRILVIDRDAQARGYLDDQEAASCVIRSGRFEELAEDLRAGRASLRGLVPLDVLAEAEVA